MKRIGLVHAATLSFLLIGTASLAYAQHEDKGGGQGKPDRQAEPARQDNQQHAKQDQQRGQDQQHTQQQEQRWQDQQRAQQPERGRDQQRGQDQQRRGEDRNAARNERMPEQRDRQSQQRNEWRQYRATNFDSDHRSWEQRGGYDGYRVPDDRFRRSFGRSHSFRVYGLPFLEVGGMPRFQYGGYWFNVIEPCPEYWGDDWYMDDDMYVDYYGGGYYLYDRRFPNQPGIAISISL